VYYMSHPFHSPWFDHPQFLVKNTSSSLYSLLQPAAISSLFSTLLFMRYDFLHMAAWALEILGCRKSQSNSWSKCTFL